MSGIHNPTIQLSDAIAYGDPVDARHDAYQLPAFHQRLLDATPGPLKVHVTLLDRGDLPLLQGGRGVLAGLSDAQCRPALHGEMLKLDNLTLCRGNPSHYTSWMNLLWSLPTPVTSS